MKKPNNLDAVSHSNIVKRVVRELKLGGADIEIENNLFQRPEDLVKDADVMKVLNDPAIKPMPIEEDVEEVLDAEREQEEFMYASPQYIWGLADRNNDGTIGFSELKRSMKNADAVRNFFKVRRIKNVDEMDDVCNDKLKEFFKSLKKDMREDITELEWTTYFDNFEANQIRAAEEAEAARIKEIEEEKATEAEFARILSS